MRAEDLTAWLSAIAAMSAARRAEAAAAMEKAASDAGSLKWRHRF